MKILDFIDAECRKYPDYKCREKARNLLESTIKEIQENTGFDVAKILDSNGSKVDLTNETDYVNELWTLKCLLEYYMKTQTFNTFIHPFSQTSIDYEKYQAILKHLQKIFN